MGAMKELAIDLEDLKQDYQYQASAKLLLEKFGFAMAKATNDAERDRSTWGTFSYSWHVQVGKEMERLYKVQPSAYRE
jgi:hypothetical protein